MSSVSFYSAVSETLHASPPIANSCNLSISQYYLCKSFQKYLKSCSQNIWAFIIFVLSLFLIFFSSPSPTSTEVHISNVFPLILIKIWFCRPVLQGELQSSNPLTPRLSLFSHQLRLIFNPIKIRLHTATSKTLFKGWDILCLISCFFKAPWHPIPTKTPSLIDVATWALSWWGWISLSSY